MLVLPGGEPQIGIEKVYLKKNKTKKETEGKILKNLRFWTTSAEVVGHSISWAYTSCDHLYPGELGTCSDTQFHDCPSRCLPQQLKTWGAEHPQETATQQAREPPASLCYLAFQRAMSLESRLLGRQGWQKSGWPEFRTQGKAFWQNWYVPKEHVSFIKSAFLDGEKILFFQKTCF